MDQEQIEKDFEFLKDDEGVLAILVYGSRVKGKSHECSDIDICVLSPGSESWRVLKQIFSKLDVEKKGYDVHMFEEFTLRLKHYVIEEHEVIWTRDMVRLQDYLYKYRKLWNDQAKARGVS